MIKHSKLTLFIAMAFITIMGIGGFIPATRSIVPKATQTDVYNEGYGSNLIDNKVQLDYYWNNESYSESTTYDSWTETYLGLGWNGTATSFMLVIANYSETDLYSYNSSTLDVNIYQDSSQTTNTSIDNISSTSADNQFYYYTYIEFDTYLYNDTINATFTWYNVLTVDYSDYSDPMYPYYDYEPMYNDNGDYIITGMVNSAIVYHNDTADSDGWYTDAFCYNTNGTSSCIYTEMYYYYNTDQSMYAYASNDTSGDYSSQYMELYSEFEGYSIYNDSNGNGVMDLNLTNIEGDWYIDPANTETKYTMDFLSAGSLGISDVVANLDTSTLLFSLSLNDVTAGIYNYGDDIATDFAYGNVILAYIPKVTIYFNYSWAAENSATFKIQNQMSNVYNWTSRSSPIDMLTGMSLSVDYWGYYDTESENYTFGDATATDNATVDDTSSTYVSGTFDFRIGGQDFMSIDAKGTYMWNNGTANQTKTMKTVMLPLELYDLTYNSPGDSASASWNYFLFSVCLDSWSGNSFKMDPTFTCYAPNHSLFEASQNSTHTSQSKGNGTIPGFPLEVFVSVFSAVSVLIVKKFKAKHQ